jgi:carbonic anhydrase/acetyltransferase-like protein (isoleucine patch superfamily)
MKTNEQKGSDREIMFDMGDGFWRFGHEDIRHRTIYERIDFDPKEKNIINEKRHYEYTGKQICLPHPKDENIMVNLKQIRSVEKFRIMGGAVNYLIEKGTIGGWIESEKNLIGMGWICEDGAVFDDAVVKNSAMIGCRMNNINEVFKTTHPKTLVYGNTIVKDSGFIEGYSDIYGDCQISGEAHIYTALVYGNCNICGDSYVGERSIIRDNAIVCSGAYIVNGVVVEGNEHIDYLYDMDKSIFEDAQKDDHI